MENKYVSFEVYRPVKSPTEKGEYMGKTPNQGEGQSSPFLFLWLAIFQNGL